jgi:uncharacterized membrane protein
MIISMKIVLIDFVIQRVHAVGVVALLVVMTITIMRRLRPREWRQSDSRRRIMMLL